MTPDECARRPRPGSTGAHQAAIRLQSTSKTLRLENVLTSAAAAIGINPAELARLPVPSARLLAAMRLREIRIIGESLEREVERIEAFIERLDGRAS